MRKKSAKYLSLLLPFVTAIVLITSSNSCNIENKKTQTSVDSLTKSAKDSTVKQVLYTCPMHPEVISTNKNDRCPKCGMALVEKTNEPMEMHSDKYTMALTTIPDNPKAGEEVTLRFVLTNNKTKETIKDLAVVHEKKLHLIIVSKNLSYFNHIHPELLTDGSLTVKTKFDKGGDYVLFADLTPAGESESQVFDIPLKIQGEQVAPDSMEPRLTYETEGYKINLSLTPQNIEINKSAEIVAEITKDGKPVTNLQNYLGALGHMVVISEHASMYLHVHPMEATENKENKMDGMDMKSDKVSKNGPSVVFHTNFPKSGIYKIFAQFKPGGKLITTNFVVKAK